MLTLALSYITNALELAAALVASFHYHKYAESEEKYFLHFLWFTFALDTAAAILLDVFDIPNIWMYNLYMGAIFLFYFRWYYRILKKPFQHRIVLIFALLFLGVFFYNYFTLPNDEYHSNSFVAGAVFVLVLNGFHLYQLGNSDYVLVIKHKLSFWISTALLLFNIGMIPFFVLWKHFDVWGENPTYLILLLCLNTVLYTCYIIGFVWTKKKYNHF